MALIPAGLADLLNQRESLQTLSGLLPRRDNISLNQAVTRRKLREKQARANIELLRSNAGALRSEGKLYQTAAELYSGSRDVRDRFSQLDPTLFDNKVSGNTNSTDNRQSGLSDLQVINHPVALAAREALNRGMSKEEVFKRLGELNLPLEEQLIVLAGIGVF